ncbi:DUF4097 family beta strand repeat-containing protein [Spongiimicrobium salis]|uniref:DUF4097 family beta strand repeat-containing protein n=1 Tax=Spongiimicrobium salis TaxID=1667022 RepID=UPI00374D38DA
MKTKVRYAFIVVALLVQCVTAQEKEFKEKINKEIAFTTESAENTLIVQNLNGSITVEGYNGTEIQLVVEKTIQANRQSDVDLGKKEIGLEVEKQGNEIVIYPRIPNIEYKNGHLNSSCNNNYERLSYDHQMDFTLKVPKGIKLVVGTVNQGEVEVTDMAGKYIKANNVNGGIVLTNVTGQTDVHAVNGEVQISYAKNPEAPSRYYALNGDINIAYQKNLSAAIAFKSMNGELFTDFDVVKQYAKTSKNSSNKKGKIKFKFEARPIVEIGSGSLDHNFETLNGNVIIKKI